MAHANVGLIPDLPGLCSAGPTRWLHEEISRETVKLRIFESTHDSPLYSNIALYHNIAHFESMGRPRKTPGKSSRFSTRLQNYIDSRVTDGTFATQAAAAEKLGVSPTSLSRLLTSVGPVPVRSVAEMCAQLATGTATDLFESYLLDHADAVLVLLENKGSLTFTPSATMRIVPNVKMVFKALK